VTLGVLPGPFSAITERPFSLTPDPRFFFKSRTHGRAIEALTFGLRRKERLLLVTGEVGTGKTVLCRALVQQHRLTRPLSFIPNPLITPGGLFRLLFDDFAASTGRSGLAPDGAPSPAELHQGLLALLGALDRRAGGPVIVVDEAQTLPEMVIDQLLAISAADAGRECPLQIVLVGRSRPTGLATLGIPRLDERVGLRARLMPLTREEVEGYVNHRLEIAGYRGPALFTCRAIDVLHSLSGGVPRLVNLLAERVLQSMNGEGRIDSGEIAAAGSGLELVSPRPRRFRPAGRRVS
jgi:type II secretory pathway predicted ATPase ExeA